jgi:hypothetical protein
MFLVEDTDVRHAFVETSSVSLADGPGALIQSMPFSVDLSNLRRQRERVHASIHGAGLKET